MSHRSALSFALLLALLSALAPAAVIAAGPGSISGRVTGPGNAPLGSIDVTATSATETANALTESDGTFAITDLGPGSYTVAFTDSSSVYAPGYFGAGGSVDDPAAATPVAVASGAVTDVSGQLSPAIALSGTVRDSAGRPEPDVRVVPCRDDACTTPAWTRPSGRYEALLRAGTYVLQILDRTGATIGWWGPAGVVAARADALRITLAAADVVQDLRLPPGANGPHIRGRVRTSGLDSAADVSVTACPAAGTCFGGVTRSDGTYSLAVAPGTYTVGFEDLAGLHPAGYYSAGGWVATAAEATPVAVAAADVGGIDLTFPGATVSGRVTGSGGAGLARITVRLCQATADCFQARTEADGTYAINVPPGTYRVAFTDPGGVHAPAYYRAGTGSTDVTSAATQITTTLAPVPNISETLVAGRVVKGVIYGPTGAGAAGLAVGLCASGRLCSETTSGSSGRYRLAVVPGSYRLAVTGTVAGQAIAGYLGLTGFTESLARSRVLAVRTADLEVSLLVSEGPQPAFVLGGVLSSAAASATVPMRQGWSVTGARTDTYALRRSTDGGAFTRIASLAQAAGIRDTFDTKLALRHRYRFDVQRSGGGTTDAVQAGPQFTLTAYQEGSSAIAYRGAWSVSRATSASGGTTRVATAAGARATFTFTGRAVAWIAPRGSSQGSARVFIDGELAATVNLAGSTAARRIAFTQAWPVAGKHTLRIEVLGTRGHPAVQVDAFVVAR